MDVLALKPGTEITISAMANGEKLDFKSKVVEPYGDTLLIEEIKNDNNEAISFVSDNVTLEMSSINSKMLPIIWKDVEVRHVRLGKNYYHRVIQKDHGKLYNRRNAYRLPVDRGAVVQVGANQGAMDVTMHDVSTNGFSFITDKELDSPKGTEVHIMCMFDEFNMDLKGVLARTQKLSPNRILYGVRIKRIYPKLDKFIMEKQRAKASHDVKPASVKAEEKYQKLANMKAQIEKQESKS